MARCHENRKARLRRRRKHERRLGDRWAVHDVPAMLDLLREWNEFQRRVFKAACRSFQLGAGMIGEISGNYSGRIKP